MLSCCFGNIINKADSADGEYHVDSRLQFLSNYLAGTKVNLFSYSQDVFRLTYDKSYNRDRAIDFKLSSPQVVIIPDILPDLYNFIDTAKEPEKKDVAKEGFI